MKRRLCLCLLMSFVAGLWAQQLSKPHGIYTQVMTVTMTPSDGQAEIRYTLDGSEPTMESAVYRKALVVSKTTVVRAGEVDGDTIRKPVVTATYVYPQSVMSQPNDPEGYPDHWGKYAQMKGTAPADYEMDVELTSTADYRRNIREGLSELPLLSLVTDRDYFFGLEEDEQRGGIYIYTGAPVGSGAGRGWERPVSMELIGGPQQHDLTVDCVVKIHGGHGRLPEKNPKHSLRIMFKGDYGGPGKLHYPVFGDRGVTTFNSLVLRAMFGNSWQHWDGGQRRRAQYCRDLWTRHMQRRLGHPFADGIYVHLFINGLYWGIYNIAERIDDDYCKEHFGGKKSDYDVVKVDETNGNRTVAGDGNLDKWNEMLGMVRQAATDNRSYYRLQGMNSRGERVATLEPLLDIDNFIDYMLINQYAGNTDWDYHNWIAIRRRTDPDKGFRFICWDTECIFESLSDNRLSLDNGSGPTGIFLQLMRNRLFQNRYVDRATQLLRPPGMLSPEPVVALWDSLYHTIASSLYAESARWGDYRRDVHPYTSRGELYTPDEHYEAERQRLLYDYFPYRSERVLSDIERRGWYSTGIDDWAIDPSDQRGDGQLERAGDETYDLQGRRVERRSRRGIYIRNHQLIIH